MYRTNDDIKNKEYDLYSIQMMIDSIKSTINVNTANLINGTLLKFIYTALLVLNIYIGIKTIIWPTIPYLIIYAVTVPKLCKDIGSIKDNLEKRKKLLGMLSEQERLYAELEAIIDKEKEAEIKKEAEEEMQALREAEVSNEREIAKTILPRTPTGTETIETETIQEEPAINYPQDEERSEEKGFGLNLTKKKPR